MSRGAESSSRCGGGAGGGGGSGSDGFSDGFARAVLGAGAGFVLAFAGFGFAPALAGFAAFPFCDLPFVFATGAP